MAEPVSASCIQCTPDPLRFPQACVQVTRKTSEGCHRTGKLSVRHHMSDTDACMYIPCELSMHTLVRTNAARKNHMAFSLRANCAYTIIQQTRS
jgi:hypothetical protein